MDKTERTDVDIVGEISNTQRISLKSSKDGVVLQKDYRKSSTEDWITSKGIQISKTMIPELVERLTRVL